MTFFKPTNNPTDRSLRKEMFPAGNPNLRQTYVFSNFLLTRPNHTIRQDKKQSQHNTIIDTKTRQYRKPRTRHNLNTRRQDNQSQHTRQHTRQHKTTQDKNIAPQGQDNVDTRQDNTRKDETRQDNRQDET